MQMTDRHRQRIRRVVRRRRLREAKQQLDHLLHLTLLGSAVTDDSTLHLGGRVLHDRAVGLDGCQQRDTARVSELERAARVHGMKHTLDCDAVGPRLREQIGQFPMDSRQTGWERIACGGRDGAAGHEAMAASVRLHAAVAGALGAGVDADNSHAREASISFSSMSKFAHTCCTSSWSSKASINFSITWASLPCSLT